MYIEDPKNNRRDNKSNNVKRESGQRQIVRPQGHHGDYDVPGTYHTNRDPRTDADRLYYGRSDSD